MLSREEILSAYKEVNFPEKLFDSSIKDIKNIIFFEKSTQPSSAKDKDTKQLSQSYVLPWRLVQKNYPDANNNKNTFNRGVNFAPKEPLVEIKVDNFKLMYDKFSIPVETGVIYLKNNYGGTIGPFNLDQLHNMYKNKKFDSTFEFRTIDIFSFKDSDLFSFQSIKNINDEKWVDSVIDSPLLKYSELSKNKKEEKREEKKEVKKEVKKEEIKKEEVKKDVKKEEKDKKEEKKEDKKEEKKKDEQAQGKWEVVVKKKKKDNKENKGGEEENNEIIGLKTKEPKEGNKKGKKKKKGQFEDTNFELGFQIK
jgi:hypothetical protein